MVASSCSVQAADTNPPTLTTSHTWIQKAGARFVFNLLLDPRDDQGIERLEYREKLNSTVMPANATWRTAYQNGESNSQVPWKPAEPLTLEFNCTSMVLQVRAVDTSGNFSEVITRTYKSPFPLSSGPNLTPAFGDTALDLTGGALDCRGLFTADFDGDGRDDLAVFDRATGQVTVRRQNLGDFTSNGVTVATNSITDGAVGDFNGDGKPDLAVVVDNTVVLYQNDGLSGGVLQFSSSAPIGLLNSGMAEVRHIVAGDVTGEGQVDLVVTGTGNGSIGGSDANVAILINNEPFTFDVSNNVKGPAGSSPGRVALGDFNGDGWNDVAMIDAANKQVIVFQNRGNGSLAAFDEAEEGLRPLLLKTGSSPTQAASLTPNFPMTPQSLAVGDITGDGRADVVVTVRAHFASGSDFPPVFRNYSQWQFMENRSGGFQRWGTSVISQSAPTEEPADFPSDVVLQDLNKDRLPELVFTSYFDQGIRAFRMKPWLNRQNELNQFQVSNVHVGSTDFPQRLTAARFGINSKKDIVVANGATPQINWWFTTSAVNTDKLIDLSGGASTSSNPSGSQGDNGAFVYTEYPGGTVNYSLTYINNSTTNAIDDAVIECALPKGVTLVEAGAGHESQTTAAGLFVRWNLDIPAGTSGIKEFKVRVVDLKAGVALAPKNTMKQGTKILVSSSMPVVKILAPDFTAVPTTIGQPWSFKYKPLASPPAGAVITVQTSPNGATWSSSIMSPMVRLSPTALEWNLTTDAVSAGSRYFRAAIAAPDVEMGTSSVFNTFLPVTTAFKVSSKSPPKSGNTWTFTATQTSTAAYLSVRFQSTLTPLNEGSWTDLPVQAATTRAGNVWTSVTYNVPSGARHFRAISAAPGWVDSISGVVGPVPVEQTTPHLPPFTHFHVDFKDPATHGQPAAFMATCGAVPGLKVRFQTRMAGGGDNAWTDLTEGVTSVAGTKWTFKTNYMPVGNRDWRAIASAPGYDDNTEWSNGSQAMYTFEVLPAPLPQIPTIFGAFISPENGSLHRTGVSFPISIDLFDFNGVKRVYLEAGKPGALKEVAGTNMTLVGGVTYLTNVTFTGAGPLTLRVAVADNFTPSQISRSEEVTITVGPGGGISSPTIAAFSNALTQATLKSRGAVKVKTRIGDDKGVRRAFLHRSNASGGYVSTVGEMVRASAANPADFTCTDSNLSDGTYYYRVVAEDYDGNETLRAEPTAYTITTPAPPPSPIHLDIVAESRLVAPTFPAATFNYVYLPLTTSGMVTFNYSGLPTGTNRFVAYRTDLGPNQPYWEQTVTKTSGLLKIKAPWWKDSKVNPNTGEGDYRIVCFQGSTQIDHGTGVNTFTVGHAWNTPDTFKTLDWGLYWFKDGKSGLLGVNSAQNDEYFDPNKPTVIYVHGWQPGETKVGRREGWMRQDPYKESTYVDCCKIWKDEGYNVGIFNWNQFGDGDLLFSQANIYYVATEDDLPDGHSLIYALRNADGSSSRHYLPYGEGGDIEGKPVAQLLVDELERCLAGYTPSANKEFRLIGHSLGTQVVGRACELIRLNPGLGVPLPTRVCLLEMAQVHGFFNSLDIPALQRGYITNLVNRNVAVECYQSTDLQSIIGVNLAFVGPVHDMSAYCRWRPDYIQPIKVGLDVFQKSHNEIVRWYMQSFDYNEFPAFTYWAPFNKRDAVGKGLSASTSLSRVKSLMGGQYYYEQSEGKNSAGIADDQFERKTR